MRNIPIAPRFSRVCQGLIGIVLPVLVIGFWTPPAWSQLSMSSLNLTGRTVGGGVSGSAAAQRSRQTGTTGTGLSVGGLTGTGAGSPTTAMSTNVGFIGASSQNMVSLSNLRGSTGTTGTGQFGTGNLGGFGGVTALGGLSRAGLGGLGVSGLAGRGIGGLGGLGGLGQPGQFGQLGSQAAIGQNQPRMQVPVRLGFPAVTSTPTSAASRFRARLERIPALAHLQAVQTVVEGSTVVLRGTVPTEYDRQVLERVALLEPGITAVRNELVVEPER